MDANPARRRANVLREYGLTVEAYQAVLVAQRHACRICERPFTGLKSRQIHVDHDHATGRFRGVLCHHCNIMLGGARDSIRVLLAGVNYLVAAGGGEKDPT